MAKKVLNNPSPDVLMNSMRSIGYSFKTAVADIIDNSISAHATEVKIYSPINDDELFIAFLDNGEGMNRDELLNAMKYGSNREAYDTTDLGRFGLGLKSASLSQCRKLTVASKKGNSISVFSWDLDSVLETKTWDCLELETNEITSLLSIAQEESRSISSNVTIGKRWAMEQGKVSWAYSNFLGYKKTEEGIEIVPEEAEIVRDIYRWFLKDGKSCSEIASILNDVKVPTPSDRGKKWTVNNITSIITNEKYRGDAVLQKTYIPDYLSHKPKKNKGELKKYHVSDSHPAIIDKEEWEMTQAEFKRRQGMHGRYSANSVFSARLVCADCGSFYGKKVWHSNDAYRKEIFQCNSKFKKGKSKCETLSLTEEEIKNDFIKAFNSTFDEKDIIIEDTIAIKNLLTDTSEEDKIIEEANVEIDVVSELVNKLINSNSKIAQDQEKYQERYNELSARYEKAKKQLEDASAEKGTKRDKSIMIERFIESLKGIDGPLVNWSDTIWIAMIDKAVIGTNYIEFEFKNGKKKKIEINH